MWWCTAVVSNPVTGNQLTSTEILGWDSSCSSPQLLLLLLPPAWTNSVCPEWIEAQTSRNKLFSWLLTPSACSESLRCGPVWLLRSAQSHMGHHYSGSPPSAHTHPQTHSLSQHCSLCSPSSSHPDWGDAHTLSERVCVCTVCWLQRGGGRGRMGGGGGGVCFRKLWLSSAPAVQLTFSCISHSTQAAGSLSSKTFPRLPMRDKNRRFLMYDLKEIQHNKQRAAPVFFPSTTYTNDGVHAAPQTFIQWHYPHFSVSPAVYTAVEMHLVYWGVGQSFFQFHHPTVAAQK